MDCKKCRYVKGSYHCMDCDSYDGHIDKLQPFCGYCNHQKGSDSCNNCVWEKKGGDDV